MRCTSDVNSKLNSTVSCLWGWEETSESCDVGGVPWCKRSFMFNAWPMRLSEPLHMVPNFVAIEIKCGWWVWQVGEAGGAGLVQCTNQRGVASTSIHTGLLSYSPKRFTFFRFLTRPNCSRPSRPHQILKVRVHPPPWLDKLGSW